MRSQESGKEASSEEGDLRCLSQTGEMQYRALPASIFLGVVSRVKGRQLAPSSPLTQFPGERCPGRAFGHFNWETVGKWGTVP